ncbi:MAG: hypothetical protein ACKV2O_14430 [Acidimicrobiales bacterium]
MTLTLEAIEDLPPETTGALTFHLPLELAALQLAGAPEAVINARIEARLTEAYAAGLVDPPFYRWAVNHYTPVAQQLLSPDPHARDAALVAIEPLAAGLAGAAFHGLIRLGYGLWRHRPAEVARGLAYLRCRRQVLGQPHWAARPGDDPDPTRPPGHPGPPASLPPAEELAGSTVFDQMNLAAGTPEAGRLLRGDLPLTVGRLLATSMALVQRNPGSFVAVHTLTGLHALCELHVVAEGPPALDQAVRDCRLRDWWASYGLALGAAGALVSLLVPEPIGQLEASPAQPDAVVAAAVASGETHNVKVAMALRRLWQFGLLEDHQVVQLARVKLAASARPR